MALSALISKFDAIAERENMSSAQLSLAWVLAQGDHVHAIPGTASISHLEENFETLNKTITTAVIEEISNLINHDTVSGHRYPERMRKAIDTEEFDHV